MIMRRFATRLRQQDWFAVAIDEKGLMIRPLDAALRERRTSGIGTEEYYCGQKCALKSIAQWMDGPPPPALLF